MQVSDLIEASKLNETYLIELNEQWLLMGNPAI